MSEDMSKRKRADTFQSLYRYIKKKAWTLGQGFLNTHVDPYNGPRHWVGVPETPQGRSHRISCSSVRCFHGLLLKRENPGLPHDALHDLAKSKGRNNNCVEICAKGRTTNNSQGSGFSAGNNIRGHVYVFASWEYL